MKTSRKVDKVAKLYGNTSNNLGKETEEKVFFYLEEIMQLGDIDWTELTKNFRLRNQLEIDGVLINGEYIGLIEIKRNLKQQDIEKYFEKTIPNFAKNCPKYWEYKKKIPILACETIEKNALDVLQKKDCYLVRANDNFQVEQFPIAH